MRIALPATRLPAHDRRRPSVAAATANLDRRRGRRVAGEADGRVQRRLRRVRGPRAWLRRRRRGPQAVSLSFSTIPAAAARNRFGSPPPAPSRAEGTRRIWPPTSPTARCVTRCASRSGPSCRPGRQATATAASLVRASAVFVVHPSLAHRLSATLPFMVGHLRPRRSDAVLAASPCMSIDGCAW